METKLRLIKKVHESDELLGVTFFDGTRGFAKPTELGCLVYQPQENSDWYETIEYDLKGNVLSNGVSRIC